MFDAVLGRASGLAEASLSALPMVGRFRQEGSLREATHRPWPLQRATVELDVNTMAEPLGIELSSEPICHFSRRQNVALWRLAPVE